MIIHTLQISFEFQDKTPNKNLWNVLINHLVKGDFTLYQPYDPEWMRHTDDGKLIYPVSPETHGMGPTHTFLTDSVFREYCVAYGLFAWIFMIRIQSQSCLSWVKIQLMPMGISLLPARKILVCR